MRLALAILLTCVASAPAAEIVLRKEAAQVTGSLVRLSDVARVTGDDAERLGALPLMPAPTAGTRQFVSAASVRDMLAALGESPETHRFGGAYRVLVSKPALARDPAGWRTAEPKAAPAAQSPRYSERIGFRVRTNNVSSVTRRIRSVSPHRVKQSVTATVQQALDARTREGTPRLLVRGIRLSATALRELGEFDQETLVVMLPDTVHPGAVTARVQPSAREGDEAFIAVVQVIEQPERVVATMPIARGATITASSVMVELVPPDEIDRRQSLGYTQTDQVIGLEARRQVNAGDVLSSNNTEQPLMVRRNEEVEVLSGIGGITVRMVAMAKQDGRKGDLISVQFLDRDETLSARVVGPRRLAVLSSGSGLAGVTRAGGRR